MLFDDVTGMRRALRLAALGRHASPNPMVGCVICNANGERVGEGYHPYPGEAHAEVFALRQADHLAVGATAYVTLEPCSHYGRTPPCTSALIAAGVARVVIATEDPDHRVSGRGIALLRSAGIEVQVGLMEAEAKALNAAYILHRQTGRPWVTVKIATSLDGKSATASGDSRWITSSLTRRWVHRQLRDRSDAILVGVGTVLKDNPSLTTRLVHKNGRNPLRIIVDSQLRTPLSSHVVHQSEEDGKTIMVCLARFAQERQQEYLSRGVTILVAEADSCGRPELGGVIDSLGTRGDITSVLIEGGSTVIASAMEAGIVNRYVSTIAPKLVGGVGSPGAIGGNGLASTMKYAVPLKSWHMRQSSSDLVIDALLFER